LSHRRSCLICGWRAMWRLRLKSRRVRIPKERALTMRTTKWVTFLFYIGKSRIFTKNDDKNTNLLKNKIEFDEFETTPKKEDQQLVKSKSNLLNLSILKHLWSLWSVKELIEKSLFNWF
jgi:hypothetical protein